MQALAEFDALAEVLREAGINLAVLQDSAIQVKPDAVFPNNWSSSHAYGTLVVYPMLTENRRLEWNDDIITVIQESVL